MRASTQTRILVGCILRASMKDGTTDYIGPFASEYRASQYRDAMQKDMADIVGSIEIEDLTIPHALHVYVETQY